MLKNKTEMRRFSYHEQVFAKLFQKPLKRLIDFSDTLINLKILKICCVLWVFEMSHETIAEHCYRRRCNISAWSFWRFKNSWNAISVLSKEWKTQRTSFQLYWECFFKILVNFQEFKYETDQLVQHYCM